MLFEFQLSLEINCQLFLLNCMLAELRHSLTFKVPVKFSFLSLTEESLLEDAFSVHICNQES